MMQGWILWLAVAILAFIFEAMTVGLTTLWFGVGAVITALLTAALDGVLGGSSWFLLYQVVFFVLLSGVLLALTRPLSKKIIKPRETNALSAIGKRAVVHERIDNIEGGGQIKLNGNVWTARSEDGSVIEQGEIVEVTEIVGVSAIVKKII